MQPTAQRPRHALAPAGPRHLRRRPAPLKGPLRTARAGVVPALARVGVRPAAAPLGAAAAALGVSCRRRAAPGPGPAGARGARRAGGRHAAGCLPPLTEEELLEAELAEEDLAFDAEEEEEWRAYDEDVRHFGQLLQEHSGDSAGSDAALRGALTDEELRAVQAVHLQELLQLHRSGGEAAEAPPERPTPSWAPAGDEMFGAGVHLSAESVSRLTEHGGQGSVVVSNDLGPNTVVLISRAPGQPEQLPVLSETFRAQSVRITRMWLDTVADGVPLDVFEICDAGSADAGLLPEQRAAALEEVLAQAVKIPVVRAILFELGDQVPRLLAFFGLPADGSRAPPLPAARQALAGGPFEVSEAFDLRRALVFRGEVAGGASSLDAVRESAQRLRSLAGCGVGQWECLLVRGVRGLLLVVVPREELEEYLNAPLPPVPALLLSYGVTSVYAQAAVPSVAGEPPLSPALLLVFGVFALAEAARYAAARYHGVRLLAPLPMPSAAYGSFGSATRVASLVPSAVASFDMAAAASAVAFAASLGLVAFGLLAQPSELGCAWFNPGVLSFTLKEFVLSQAPDVRAACPGPPPGGDAALLPVPQQLAAGCFGLMAAALATLPLPRTDGEAIVSVQPSNRAGYGYLPYAAGGVLCLSIFGSDSYTLFPMVLSYCLLVFTIRPFLVGKQVLQDATTWPQDLGRQLLGSALIMVSFALLFPSSLAESF